MDNKEALMIRLKKLLNLAQQGVGGEAKNAQSFLEKLLEKNGMSMADLMDEEQPTSLIKFGYKNAMEKDLILQIYSKVINTDKATYYDNRRRKSLRVDITAAQHAEMIMYVSALKPALHSHIKIAFSAFVNANNIFPESTEAVESNLSEKERWALMNMIQGTTKTPIYKAIKG